MKKNIQNLIQLAEQYVEFGKKVRLLNTHNHIRGGHQNCPDWSKPGDLINVYLNYPSTWSVTFGKIEIVGYSKSIRFPFDSTTADLAKVYKDAKNYLETYLLPKAEEFIRTDAELKAEKIKDLESQLKSLINS